MTNIDNLIFPYPTEPTPVFDPDADIELLTLDSLKVGEVDDNQQIEISNSIVSMNVTLRSKGLSQISFTVYDPGFKMHDNNFFLIERLVEFNGMLYEVASVRLIHGARDLVEIIARNFKMQEVRREKGNHSWGAISPTALARVTARKHGLGFVGESSPVNGTIARVQNDKTDESTYDVLRRLANELEFMFFEAKDFLFFASEEYIVDVQGQVRMFVPGRDAEIDPVTGGFVTDIIFPLSLNLKRDEDAEKPSTFNANVFTNATTQQIYPGLGCSFHKVVERFDENGELVTSYEEPFPNFEDLFFIDQVKYSLGPNQPTLISGSSINPASDMLCSIREYELGDGGLGNDADICIKRIQRAIGMEESAITGQFDDRTEEAVIVFQKANILRLSDTPAFEGDNWKDIMTLGKVGKVTWAWIKALNMSEVTVPIPILRGRDADDEIKGDNVRFD